MDFFQYEETNTLRRAVNWIVQIVVVIALAWLCVYAFGTGIKNSGQSMQPVLSDGESALMDRAIFHFRDPKRGEVIVFRTAKGEQNIKRIVGMPGETLQIKDGTILINGAALPEGENLNPGKVSLSGLASNPVVLAEDEYFVLGDNRDASEDSRFDAIGNIKRKNIIGKLWLRFSPLSRMGLIK